jgi:hypothetical protein
VRLILPRTIEVLTEVTPTSKARSTASLICGLFEAMATSKTYLPWPASIVLFSVTIGRRSTS